MSFIDPFLISFARLSAVLAGTCFAIVLSRVLAVPICITRPATVIRITRLASGCATARVALAGTTLPLLTAGFTASYRSAVLTR